MAVESARVARRCMEAKESYHLDLSSCDLRKFPDAVYLLMKEVPLESVELSHNNLNLLPSKFGTKLMMTITKLDLSYNELSTLPLELINLSNLTTLNIASNSIHVLPEAIPELSQLVCLDISDNNIASLPPTIERLSCLEVLKTSSNQLTDLSSVSLLGNLKELDASSNKLCSVDVQMFSRCPWLESINVSGNPFDEDTKQYLMSLVNLKFIFNS